MLDALFEAAARFVGSFLVEFVFYTVFYSIGWVMLKTITLGRYPPQRPARHNEELVAVFPIVTLLVGVTLAFS